MRICMLTSGHDVFDNRIYYKEILSLKKKYDEIYMIAPGKMDFVTEDGVIVKCFEPRKSWKDRIRPMKEMFKLGMEIKADVYHAHEPDSFQVAVKLKKAIGSKAIYDSHEYYPEAFSEHFGALGGVFKTLIYHYEKHIAKQADYIVTVNNILVEKFKAYNKNVELIPNYPVLKGKTIEKNYSEKPVFIYVGGLREDRGILKTLEAAKLVKNDVKYVFVGDFDNEEFRQRVNNYVKTELKDVDVVFTGKIPHLQVFDYLKTADAGFVLLQPYSWRYVNSEPIKLFEYMMSKTPVIASDFPMMRSIVEGSNCGFAVQPDDPVKIAEIIDYIAENREKVKAMGENGFNAVNEEYNWGVLEKRLLNVYDSLKR
jgi:glycosyltransferase involved in cell wall biosynthesis